MVVVEDAIKGRGTIGGLCDYLYCEGRASRTL